MHDARELQVLLTDFKTQASAPRFDRITLDPQGPGEVIGLELFTNQPQLFGSDFHCLFFPGWIPLLVLTLAVQALAKALDPG